MSGMFALGPGVTVGVDWPFAVVVAVGALGVLAAGVGDVHAGALCASMRRLPGSSPALPVDGILIVAGAAASTGGAAGTACATVCGVAAGHGAVDAAAPAESLRDVAAPEAAETENAVALTPRTNTDIANASFMLALL